MTSRKNYLPPELVVSLRERYAAREASCEALGREYGLSRSGVWYVVTGKTHPEEGGPITLVGNRHRKRTLVNPRPRKYPDEMIVRAREMVRDGASEVEASHATGMSRTHVSSVVRGKARANAGGPISDAPRYARGESVRGAILDREKVEDILRNCYPPGAPNLATQDDMARKHHVSRGMVGHIVHRRKWVHVPIPDERAGKEEG